jgi:hypothetical protein
MRVFVSERPRASGRRLISLLVAEVVAEEEAWNQQEAA